MKNWLNENFSPGLVSVIIPTYNRQKYIGYCIESVRQQHYRPIECIIVDDGSTDDTKKIVDEFSKICDKGFNISYFLQKNNGAQVARNNGTSKCKGEFIQYLDSDDLLYPQKLAFQVDFLQSNQGVDAVFGNWEEGDLDKKQIVQAKKSEDIIAQLIGERCIVNFSFLMRRSLVNKIGQWDISIARNQEMDFQLRGVLQGACYQHQDIMCGLWRTHKSERIANKTGSSEILFFYEKWENLLISYDLLSKNVRAKMSAACFWAGMKSIKADYVGTVNLLEKAVDYDPSINFINSFKMKIFKQVFGRRNAVKLWVKFIRIKSHR